VTGEPGEDAVATRTARLGALVVALAGGVAVLLLATRLFPAHSLNHDEAVYLQQAAMLLKGQLFLYPPVPEAFRPWFFVADPVGPRLGSGSAGSRLYPKYAPVPAAMFAAGELLGGYRLALAATAGGSLGLCYGVAAAAFDRVRGLLAAVLLLASPLFLVGSAVFLPYAPTTLWNLAFAFCYLRADRLAGGEPRRARRYAAAAGGAAGVAFFARPYTAVLFAAPFISHALWTLRSSAGGLDRAAVRRQLTTAAVGLVGVAATGGYNWVVTGDPTLFPYLAFAPQDGLGFGYHELVGYGTVYTPALALETTVTALVAYATEWVVAGLAGTALALVGAVVYFARARDGLDRLRAPPVLLAVVALAVVAGNAYFWGTLNAFGELDVAGDGLAGYLGPYYHFDLLVPTVAFAAHGAVTLAEWTQAAAERLAGTDRFGVVGRPERVTAVALLLVAAAGGNAAVATAAEPLRDNRAVTEELTAAYEPFDGGDYTDGGRLSADRTLVFLPTPYGDWLNHPFQRLRNDPGYDRGTVYALRERRFAVVDAFPDRRYYRYVYRGEWAPFAGESVTPAVKRVRHVRGERVRMHATLGVPAGVQRVSVRLASEEGEAYYAGTPAGTLDVTLRVADERARLAGGVQAVGDDTVAVNETDELLVTVFLDYGSGTGFSYRLELPTRHVDGEVRALSPYREACRLPARCGGGAAYIPGQYRSGVWMNVTLAAGDR